MMEICARISGARSMIQWKQNLESIPLARDAELLIKLPSINFISVPFATTRILRMDVTEGCRYCAENCPEFSSSREKSKRAATLHSMHSACTVAAPVHVCRCSVG